MKKVAKNVKYMDLHDNADVWYAMAVVTAIH